MRRSPFMTLAMAAALTACSKGNLTVTVLDPASVAISGANVTLSPQGTSGVTDSAGQAKLNDLDKGKTVVLAEKPGYTTKAAVTNVEANSSVTIQLSSAKTTVKVYQGTPTTNPYTVTVPEATLSGNVVVQVYVLWNNAEWLELPYTANVPGYGVTEFHARVGEGFVKFENVVNGVPTVGGVALGGAGYKIVVTIPPSGSPKKVDLW